jgi:hypothetical protein
MLMTMVDQQTHQQITDLVNACAGYWELRGIPQQRRKEMRLELEQHVEQAIRDGKSLEAVVGPNALAFAESWARETPHQVPRGGTVILRWLVFDWLVYALLFLVFIALFDHLILRSPSFSLTLAHVVSCAFIGVCMVLLSFSGFLSPRVTSREHRLRVAFGAYMVISLLMFLLLSLTQFPWHLVLLRWDWPVTLVLLLVAGGLFSMDRWLARKDRHRDLR